MFNTKKLKKEDLDELRKRTELINQKILTAQALDIQKKIYIRSILPKYKLDPNQNYEIDLRNGLIKKAKNSKPKE